MLSVQPPSSSCESKRNWIPRRTAEWSGPSGRDQAKYRPSSLRRTAVPAAARLLLNDEPIDGGGDAVFVGRDAGGYQSANGRRSA